MSAADSAHSQELTHAPSQDQGIVGEPCDLAELIEQATVTWKLEARRQGIDLVLRSRNASPVPSRIICDPSHLRKIVSSLVGNACQNTQRGSIVVEWGCHTQVTIVGDRPGSPTDPRYFISV